MRTTFDTCLEYDSSSRSSTGSPAGESFLQYPSALGSYCSLNSPGSQSQGFTNVRGTFTPTITEVSTSPDLQWMLQPTSLPSPGAAAYSRPAPYSTEGPNPGRNPQGMIKIVASGSHTTARRGRMEQLSSEEEEKKRLRRERNKMAAAKCRNRRRELTEMLQAETDTLEDEKSALQTEIDNLLKEKEKLEFILLAHKPVCKVASEMDTDLNELGTAHDVPSITSNLEPATICSKQAPFAASPALGNSSTVLMSELDSSLEESLDLLESLSGTAVETSQAVPDIDLSSSFYTQDWEPLYTPAMGDLEPLCTPVVTCTPACTTFVSTFTYPEAEPLATCRGAHRKESGNSDRSTDSCNPSTLVSL